MHVDQTGTDDLAARVDRLRRVQVRLRPQTDKMLAANPHVGNLIEILRGIDDAAVGDAQGVHGVYCRESGSAFAARERSRKMIRAVGKSDEEDYPKLLSLVEES